MLTEDPADFITVGQLKTHMKKASAVDDAELASFVSTACQMIRERIGEVSPATAVSEVCAYGSVIVLEHRPVIEVTALERLPGLEDVPAGDAGTGTDGWLLASKGAAILHHTSRFPGRVRVTYVAGRDPIPGNVTLAALELAAHLWRGPKNNAGGQRPSISGDAAVVTGSTFALPIRVRELLGLGARVPRDEMLVG